MTDFFHNKVAWVIGASSGIGEQLAVQLANQGARVILSARNLNNLEKVQKGLRNPENHVLFPLDLEHLDGLEQDLEKLIEKIGKVDFVFNNGGVSQRGLVADTAIEVDRKIMEINYFGNIIVSKAVLPHFRKQGGGHFIIMSSIAGKFGFFLRSSYSAAKHALHGYYESLRLEEEKNNVRVLMVCPGKINTAISTNALTSTGERHGEMDHNQATGMAVEECVEKILKALKTNKKEVLIGNKEILAVYIKRFFPGLFYKIIRKQSAV